MLDAQQTYSELGLPAPDEATGASWAKTLSDYPDDAIPFLSENYVRECGQTLKMKSITQDALLGSLGVYMGAPALSRFAWHWHKRLSGSEKFRWPLLPQKYGDGNKLFYALLFLS